MKERETNDENAEFNQKRDRVIKIAINAVSKR